jgi:hypothetical protein
MQLKFRGYLTPAHTLLFKDLVLRRGGARPINMLTVAFIASAIGVLSIFVPVVGTVFWFVFSTIMIQSWFYDRKLKKAYLNGSGQPGILREGTITEEGFSYTNRFEQVTWKDLTEYTADQGNVVIFQRDSTAYFFSREFFENQQDWDGLMRLIESRLVRKEGTPTRKSVDRGPARVDDEIRREIEDRIRRFELPKGGDGQVMN